MKFITYSNTTFKKTPYYQHLPATVREEFNILSSVFHFKVNNYVLEHLIDWDNVPYDPMYRLVFPRKEMLASYDYQQLALLYQNGLDEKDLYPFVQRMKRKMSPEVNHAPSSIPTLGGLPVKGMYRNFDTIISLFPDPMVKTCHAYCSYCFRWIMFNNREAQSNSSYKDPFTPIEYLKSHPEITDVLFTGADPLVLKAETLKKYIDPILELESVQVIRISSKSLAWWPYRFITDKDAAPLLELFEYIQSKGKHLNFCAHFTHPKELENEVVQAAVKCIQETGATIRCQGPLVKDINDSPEALRRLWTGQINLGMIPYYLFIEADHNPLSCFRMPLAEALQVFQGAQKGTTGLARTVRGPVFMNDLNRILLDGTTTVNGEKYFVLKTLQCPPGLGSEGSIKLIPYDEQTKDLGNLFELFNKEVVAGG